jgi:hypothetical protein
MRVSLITAIANLILELPNDGLTSEETQFLLKQMDMEEQMLRQLVMTSDYEQVKLLLKKRNDLMDSAILKEYNIDEVAQILGYHEPIGQGCCFPESVMKFLKQVEGTKAFDSTVMAYARSNGNFEHLFKS